MASRKGASSSSGGRAEYPFCRDVCLLALGFAASLPLLLLPSRLALPRSAGWAADHSHVHGGAVGGGGGGGDGGRALAALAPGAGGASPPPPPPARLRHVCTGTDTRPPADVKYDVMGAPGSSTDSWAAPVCHWASLRHPAVAMAPLDMCTHDPAQDKIISTFLHTYGFWDSPDVYNVILAAGPCTAERPYMLDIGANLGLWTLVSVANGCKAVSFEPLSQNILRVRESLRRMGKEAHARLYKHAAGKKHGDVSINFFASNPGASALGGARGADTETMTAVTVDGLLLGDPALRPSFPGGPPVDGAHVAWAKLDTEGWDVAVFDGAMRTLLGGRVPLIMVEFSPGDARGVAGCDPAKFVTLLYANGYRMYQEGGRVYRLKALLDFELARAEAGVGRRVFEVFFIEDGLAARLMARGVLQPWPAHPASLDRAVRKFVMPATDEERKAMEN